MGALFVFVYFICLLLFSAAYVTYAIYSQAGRAFSLKPCPPSPCVKTPSKPCFGFGGVFLCTAMKKLLPINFGRSLIFIQFYYSHSIVAGGLVVMSYTTLLMLLTSLTILFEAVARTS